MPLLGILFLPENLPLQEALTIVVVYFVLCVLVGWLATSYQRSADAWFVLAVLFGPEAAFVFLLVANVPHAAAVRSEKEERVRREHPEWADVQEVALSELACPKCGATVNPATGDGLHSPEDEPWMLICNQCGAEIEP
jgi:hypothetical protein